ncbi:protein of unknown function [Pseudodesulfovibrio piezophilus C1TLV30]|uniref:Type VI secretion system spike protein VgrG3-like C-terminal domain-containing protein n=1 Tax=Pseudodesulfovibrio piezophilus (strain DSM 21447 / JCM 15486 / C1TLV30) TaxID=1322246 RepID=M1WRT1_PSEP2|nr:hypothetical protein [Pseudodesulfovibrio piezophilus]CCH48492.1 protein of unknown function [Pseudodesulfovibrio piezophilus C1TLV30]
MYDKYLTYAGVDLKKARASENEDVPGAKPGFKMEDAEMYAENDTGTASDAGGEKRAKPEADESSAPNGEEGDKGKPQSTPEDPLSLGKLSEKYETGGRGAGTVSTGKGDPGGVSYGLYQMTSKNHETGETGGTVEQYVESDDFPIGGKSFLKSILKSSERASTPSSRKRITDQQRPL